MGIVTGCPGVAGISSGIVSDGLAGTGVAVGVTVGVAVAVDVGVGVGVDICTEPSSVSPSKRSPSSVLNVAGGSDENPTAALSSLQDAPSVTVRATSMITPSGIASAGWSVSAITVSISPSVSPGSCTTLVTPNASGTISLTESATPSKSESVASKSRHDSS